MSIFGSLMGWLHPDHEQAHGPAPAPAPTSQAGLEHAANPANHHQPIDHLLGGFVGGLGGGLNYQGSGFQAGGTAGAGVGGQAGRTADGYAGNLNLSPLAGTLGVSGSHGSLSGEGFLHQTQIGGNAGASNGVYHADATYSNLSGVRNVDGHLDTQYGNVDAHLGSFSRGESIRGGGSINTNTGVAEVHGEYGGPIVRDARVGYDNKAHNFGVNAGVGDIVHGTDGDGHAEFNSRTGTFTAGGNVTTGGMGAHNVSLGGHVGNTTIAANAGEISNNTQLTNLNATVDANHARVGGDYDGGGFRVRNADLNVGGTGPVTAQAHVGEFGSTNQVKGGFVDANWRDGSVTAGAKDVAWGSGLWGENMSARINGPGGVSAAASVGSFSDGLEAHDMQARIDRNGLNASVREADYSNFRLANANASVGNADYNANAHLGGLNLNQTHINGGTLAVNGNGIAAHADHAEYNSVNIQDANLSTHLGNAYSGEAHLGSGQYNAFRGDNVNASLTRDGLAASVDHAGYDYLAGRDIRTSQSFGNGAVTTNLSAGSASFGGGTADHLELQSNLRNAHLGATNLNAHGLDIANLNAGATVGNVGANVGARNLNLLDLNVGQLDARTSNFGTQGNLSVQNANLDAVNIQGGHAGLSVGGREMVGVNGDYRAGASIGSANANYDLLHGNASVGVQNAHLGAQMNNASVNLFGNNVALPSMGADLRVDAGANADLAHGRAGANLNLGGSSVNFAGHQLTVPDFVQANANVDMSRGAANAQIGGRNGVGGHMDLSRGELTVNAFGGTLDVAQTARDTGHAIASGASTAYNAVANTASAATHAVTDTASNAWNAVSHW